MKCPATDCSIQLVRKRRIIYNNDWNKLKPSSRTIYVVYIYKTRTSRFFSFFLNKISLSNIKLLIFIYNQKTAISSFWGESAARKEKAAPIIVSFCFSCAQVYTENRLRKRRVRWEMYGKFFVYIFLKRIARSQREKTQKTASDVRARTTTSQHVSTH